MISGKLTFNCNISLGFDCTDINECDLEIDDCDFEADCINTDGGFTCECVAGYEDNACNAGWSQQFGFCHKVFTENVEFATAKANCEAEGMFFVQYFLFFIMATFYI